MKNLNLIRSIAWSFHWTTGLDYKELFGEASLAYYEAMQMYNADKGVKPITYAHNVMRYHLINFCKKEKRMTTSDFPQEEYLSYEQIKDTFKDTVKEWPIDCRKAVDLILQYQDYIFDATLHFTRNDRNNTKTIRKRKVKEILMNQGWSKTRIEKTIKNIRICLNSAPDNCII